SCYATHRLALCRIVRRPGRQRLSWRVSRIPILAGSVWIPARTRETDRSKTGRNGWRRVASTVRSPTRSLRASRLGPVGAIMRMRFCSRDARASAMQLARKCLADQELGDVEEGTEEKYRLRPDGSG